PENIVWQTRLHEQTDFEKRLADAMEAAFSDGVTELDDLIARLNAEGIRDPDDCVWTQEKFRAVMAELGA
ncbi:MAG: recombinase-like helix-turn-helix domain-containing protein, partial [Alphaproteobacteria bacterium]